MSNIEVELFNTIANAVNVSYPNCKMLNQYVRNAPSWPCVMFYEADNYSGGMDGSNNEVASNVTYEVQVFSAKEGDSKTEAVAIMRLIDGLLTPKGFRRMSLIPAENLEDATVYRLVARYAAAIQSNTIFRR